jgi:hypothetical protein
MWMMHSGSVAAHHPGGGKKGMASPKGGQPPRDGGPDEAADYLRDAITELAQMAHRHRLEMLGYLLGMALMEADEMVRARGGRSAR